MNLVPRINKDKLQIFDSGNGSIKRSISLPGPADYSGPVLNGDLTTVSVHYKNGANKSITYNIKTGTRISSISM
tara:strand:- start:1381 stop:1602 length:222 start_codon:yes stop_codon:yes gene_type:complete